MFDWFFQIDANEEDCYYDRVKSGTKMGLIFEVSEGGALDIDVKIEGKNTNYYRLDGQRCRLAD